MHLPSCLLVACAPLLQNIRFALHVLCMCKTIFTICPNFIEFCTATRICKRLNAKLQHRLCGNCTSTKFLEAMLKCLPKSLLDQRIGSLTVRKIAKWSVRNLQFTFWFTPVSPVRVANPTSPDAAIFIAASSSGEASKDCPRLGALPLQRVACACLATHTCLATCLTKRSIIQVRWNGTNNPLVVAG